MGHRLFRICNLYQNIAKLFQIKTCVAPVVGCPLVIHTLVPVPVLQQYSVLRSCPLAR